MSGLGAGTVGSVVFSDVEHLVGADDNEDEFTFSADGGLTGAVEGGARGYDTVVLGGGSFDTIVFAAANANDGTIARDADVLRYTGFEPITDNTDTANRVIEASGFADEIKVSRTAPGKIKVESDNAVSTFESIEFNDPTSSLTIKSAGYIAGPVGADSVTIESLGEFNADLIIETGSLSAMEDGQDSIIFAGDIDLKGNTLEATAETITVNSGVTLKTSQAAAAGNITLNSWHTTLSSNAKLLAEGTAAGDITINATDENAIFTPILNIDIKDVGITVETGAEIRGDDVKLLAKADNRVIIDTSDSSILEPSTWGSLAGDFGLSLLDSLLGVVTVGKSTATVDVQTGSTINAKGNFEARATSLVAAVATPVTPFLAVGIALSDTTVTIGGEITTGGHATIVANAEHTVNVVSDSGAYGGVAGAAALSIIDSDTKAHVTDDAKLTIGGDLFVQASTIDRNRTMARSTSGKDGDVAVSIAVTVEGGRTEAMLDGNVTAANVDVLASMAKEVVNIKQLFVVPSLGNGTAAIAGAGTDSKGDLLDDTKAKVITDAKGGISKFATWAKEKFTGPASEKQQKSEVTKDNARSFDAAAAIAVVVDSNETIARIGDGNADGDDKNGLVAATGFVNVLSSVKSRPDITAASSASTNPDQKNEGAAETKFGGSLAVAVGIYSNDAYAHISEQAKVNAADTITVDAKALNEIDPLGLWGVNLITPFLTTANYNSLQGSQTVGKGETVDVLSGHTAGGDTGVWYKFIGDKAETMALDAEDYSDDTRWESLGNPVKHILLDKWLPSAATYLNDNLGLDGNLVDTWSQAVAEGQKTAIAGAVTVLDFNQTAEAVIKSGAKINQPETGDPVTNGDQNVVIGATSTAHFVNLSGNIKLPGITGTKNSYKPSINTPGLGSSSGEGGDAVGATVMVFDIDNTTIARIEDGVKLAADSLQVTADTFVVNAALGASGGESDDFGLNGAFIVALVDNTTLAHIENGATISVGNKAVDDKSGGGASLFLDAQDKTYVVSVSGGVATSEHIGVGLSAGVNVVTRNTEALIGNRHDKSAADTRGTVTVAGDATLNARNEGFIGTVVVAGSKASKASENPDAKSGATGMKTSDGKSTDDPGKWPNNQKSYDSVIAQLKGKQLGDSSAPAADESTGKQQGKAGIAVSGAASVNVVEDNARAYIHQAGAVTATGKALKLSAANDTHVGSLAGGIAFAGDPTSAQSDVAVAGAFGGIFVSGTTQAMLADVTSVSSKTLTIEADREGWVVSLTAGVSGASGRKGIAVGGSVGVTMTDYTTEAMLSGTTGTIAGALTVDASDDTNIIMIAGSAGFGGKAGIGAAVAFAEIANTTRATITSVTDLKHTGALSVSATAEGLIVAVTGSAGVGTGENSKAGLAGTVTVNRVANVVEAKILNSTFHKDSTGDIKVDATDNTFIFSFAGAFGASKSVGLGVAAAVNLLENTVRAEVNNSTLRSTGKLDVDADATGTLVSVALGVGAGKQFAAAGSIAVNIIDNTIESQIINGSDVKVGGAIDISADDRSVGVAIAGGAAFGKTAAIGAAFAGNFETNTVKARVDDSLVESTGSSAALGAEARATLVSVAIGGAGAQTFALGGSISVNQVENTIEASVTDANGAGTGKATLLKANNDISIAAADDTTMVIVAGGLAFSTTAAIGVSASTAQVQNKVHAYVDASKVESTSGKISVSAGFRPPDTDANMGAISLGTTGVELPEAAGSQIVNIAVGVAGSGTFAGGGAFALNWIRNDVKAYVANNATLTAAGDIKLSAFDDPEIDSFAVGGGIGTGTAGAALGLSYNYIGGDPGNPSREIPKNPGSANVGKAIANVNSSSITSTGGSVQILAGTTPKIINATIAGAGGGTAGVGGSFSINFIRSIVDASVTGNSSITANNDIKVGATATPVMITIAGNVSIGGTAGIGAAVATNDMQSKITARIDGSRAKATTGDIIVDASIGKAAVLPSLDTDMPVDAQIWTFAVSGAGAGTAAIAGSASLNWIRNVVEASISNIGDIDGAADEIFAAGKVSVTASDASTLNAIAGGFALAPTPGSVGIGASVAYNYLGGDPDNPGTTDNNKIAATISNVTGQLKAGSIEVKSNYTGSINNITIGGAGAGTFALGGAVSINNIRNTADAHISGSTGISTTSGNVAVEAKDTSTIRALAGGVGVAIAPGGGLAAAVGISVGVNEIRNTTKAYIDSSSVTSAAGLSLTADAKQKIEVLTVGGAVAVAAGDGAALAGAGAGSGNTVDNDVLAYITNSGGANEIKANNGSIALTAKDESTIRAASGGIAVSVAVGSTGAVGASIGVSASDNDIKNTVKAYIDASKVTATNGDVDLKATENATIEALSIAGSASVAGGLIGGGAFAGAGAGAGNTIVNTVQAYVSGTSAVSTITGGAVKLSASDTSKIKIDSGGVAAAVAGGAGGGLAAAAGASVAINDIKNTIQAYVADSTITSAGAVQISATSTPTIDALSISGAVAASGGAGGGISVAGSGASSENVIANKVDAFSLKSTLTSQNGGAVSITATETAQITARSVGAAAAIAVGAVGGTMTVGVGLADNEVKSHIKAYSDQSTITSAGALDLKASSSSTTESLSVAVALSVSAAPAGVAFAGGGANSTSLVQNTVEAYAVGTAAKKSDLTAAGLITISATETSKMTADVAAASMSIGLIGASVGVSIANNTADSTVKAYVDNVNLTSTGGGIDITAWADDKITKTLSVATSIALSIGGAGAGAEATATVTPTIESYVGGGATLKAAGTVALLAQSKATTDAETYGIAVGMVAVGGSVAKTTGGGTIKAHVDGTIAQSNKVSVSSDATQTAKSRSLALAGGIISGAGADSEATVNPTVQVYGVGNITAADSISFAATATPQTEAKALGISVGVGAVGVSDASAKAAPELTANPGGTSTVYNAKSFSVSTAINVPTGSYTASANSTGATGGLIGINATSVSATTEGKSHSTIADGSTLVVSDTVSITAKGDSKQRAEADSFNVGLIAVGGNVSKANAKVDTQAWLGKEVTISNGTDIGGLVDGGRYYAVLDDRRTFTSGNVDTGNNRIDLGADHGLKTGDRVVYKAGASTITGLTSLDTYSVELVAGTNQIRLRSISDEGVVGGIVDLQSAQAGTFQLADARRVRLATTSENALKSTPIVIDLNTATASGAKHQLTPVTGFAAGALEFNPATQANSSKDTLELPSGHNLLTGQAVTYGRSGGAVLTISATGTDYVHAISESGSGGVVAGAVATASTVVDSKTKAFISDDTDGDASKTLLRVSKLNINATHTSQYDSELSSIQASLVGYSGGWANNNIKTTVEATIGAGADVVTQDLQVTATNKTRKDIVSGPNVKTGSGGVIQGNNAESLSNLENRTTAAVGNNASVKVTGNVLAPGNFLLSAFNDHIGDDEVLLDTGGVFVGSGVKSHINVNVNDATAKIGNDAKIETVGALDMQSRATATFSVHPEAHTYGLAGGAGVDAGVLINNHNDVSIGDDTTVQALGDINMLAGKDRDGARNIFNIRSHGDDLNATAVPISTLKSHVELSQNNTVTIGDDAVVRTARDANLIGETLSTADIVAFGSGKNWLTAIAGGIDSLLGSGGSAEKKGGTTNHPQSQTVTVNGVVEVGILKDQKLTISKGTGNSEAELTQVTENVGGIKVTTTIESLANNLAVERRRLLQLISEYQGDLESIAAYSAALTQIEQQMFDLGLVVETTDKDGNKALSVQEGFNVPYITVDPIWAQSGTIRISGGSVLGDGQLKAPGNVNVTIKNDSPAYLRLKGITIPDNEGGTVRWNGDAVTEIKSFSGTISASGDKGSPTITVINSFNENDPSNFNHATWKLFRTPDLEIAGEISALQADVFLKSEGSVLARSNILANKLTIEAGGNFVLTATEALFHAGGSPASPEGPWSGVQNLTETAGKNGGVATKGSVTGNSGTGLTNSQAYFDAVAAALAKSPESNIVAANNVVIVAQSLNVNGILQAGIAQHKATIDTSYAAKITAAETARTQYLNGQVGSAYATASAVGITPDEGFTFFKLTGPTLKVDASGLEYSTSTDPNNNLPVFYNAQANRLEVSPVRVQGGFMSLTGRILNTNPSAEIRVMDGFGQITVKNDLDIPLQINRLDTGNPGKTNQGIEGKLIITDTGNKGINAEGKSAPLVTEYTRLGANIERKQYYFVTPGKTPTTLSSGDDPSGSGRQATYTPQSPEYRFYWTTGQDSTKKTYTTYGTSAWLNIDAFAADPSDITDGPHVEYATPRALAKGNYLALDGTYEPGEPDYTYEFERILQGTEQKRVDSRWETSTWYGETTYYTKELRWQGQKDVHTHSIRADRPVSINFIGYDEGAVTVTSKGEVQINGEIQNVKGTTSLTSTNGNIIQVNDSVTVGGKSISLTASSSIGGDAVLRTNLTNDAGGSLSASAANIVRIEEISDDLVVNQVTVNAAGDRVELKARSGSILGVSDNLVQGGLVVLEATGTIGSLGTGGTARTPGAGNMAIRVDTGSTNRDTFTAKARGDIYVHEKSGDLRLVSVDTTDPNTGAPLGNVRLVVTGGRMTDANTLEIKDSRTEAALMGVWDAMNATESTAYVSIEATARSTENLRNREYDTYWNYRQSQDDKSTMIDESKTYNASFVVTLSKDERDIFAAYYASQGFDAAKIDEAITTLQNGRTQEYHDLHKTYGKFGDSFDADYRYGTSITQVFGAGAVSGKVVTLKGNSFDTGDAVVYHSAGGSISNLVDGATYYVVADPTNSSKLSLALSRENALKAAPVVIDLGAVSGASHTFSAADLTFGGGAVSDAQDAIELPRHVFATGQAVIFQSNGTGSIAGLVDNQTYYVVADGTGKIQLAKTQADATMGSPLVIDLGAVSGNGFSLSEVDVLAKNAAWSESQLKNSFSISVLGPKDISGTTATKEAANVIGKDIVFDVTSDVGSIEAIVDIKLPLPGAGLTNTQKLALAGAERADVTFYEDLAGTVEITEDLSKTSKTVQLIRIVPKADVDVTVKGALTIMSGATVNIGSEETIGIDQINAASATRVKVQKALTDAKISAVNVISGDLIIEAEEQGIGTSTDRLVLNLHADATVVARAHDDIYLTENAGDMNVIEITSTDGDVHLVSDRSILDADDDDSNPVSFRNILANNVVLQSGANAGNLLGSIGTGTNYLEIQLRDQQLDINGNVIVAGGTVTATGDAGVHLREMTGDMLVNSVKANAGDVRLRAAAAILDYNGDPNTDVFGRSITLTADFETIGVAGDDLEIDSSFGGVGSVTTKSGKNVHLVENAGDLRLNTVSVDAGTAFIKAINGSILNAHADETTPNVLSGNVWLFASQDIGAPGLRLTTQSGKLEGQSTKGSTYILNTGALQVGGVTGSESGISSGGEVSLTSKSPITVAKHITAVNDIKIVSTDDGGDDDFVLIEQGYTVTSTAGSITIQAGDDITFEQDVQITAHNNVTVTGADDSGNADDVLIGNDVTITATTGAVAIQAGDTFTIEQGAEITAAGNIVVTTTDDAVSGANGDFILVKNGATITSANGSIELRAGDDLTIEKGAFVDADTSIVLRADYNSADVNGAAITIEGALQAPGMQLHGGEQADTIVLRPESLVGDTQVFGHGGADTITLDRLPSITTTQVIGGMVVRDTVDLDGGEGGDSYTINITGKQTDYLVNINDTGVAGDDVVTINATAGDDLFLVRENFVAYLNTVDPLVAAAPTGKLHSEIERFNYNSNVESLNINTLAGDDHLYVDDNSAKTTLDGGIGKDFFQIGQLFGTKREAPAVAVGDEISALRTTLGWLSRGVSHQTVAMGGEGDDTFQVYSNQAELGLEGNDGDDTFIVRSFALADENGKALVDQSMSKLASAMGGTGNDVVQYNVNANLAIDGGGGDDRFVLLGSELSDDFVITGETVYGGGHSITYQNVEKILVDGLQGNDNFFILGTKAGAVTTIAGGAGWDSFHVGGDITRPIVSKAFQDLLSKGLAPAGDHFATGAIDGPLFIEGGFGPEDFSLRQAVILPTELDTTLSQLVNPTDDDGSIDTLNIFNDGSTANEVSTLTADNFRSTGMAGDLTLPSGAVVTGGISYTHVETLEIMLGSGDDALTIESTMDASVDGERGPLTIVHGGGGSDHITVTGGGGANSPLVIFGDTEQDGTRYLGIQTTDLIKSGQAWQFVNAGDDVIDAGGADGAVTIFGGRGNDHIIGSEYGDQLAGGSGDDTIAAGAGDDIVYGDSGFNVSEASVTIPEPNNDGGVASRTIYVRELDVVYAPEVAAPSWADTLVTGSDTVNGGEGDDIVIGDLGLVTQTFAENLYDTTGVVLVETRRSSWGGDDTIAAAAGDDIVLGGTGSDTIDAGDGDNIIVGDNGIVELPGGELFRVSTTSFFHGGDDTITALGGQDFVFGGNANDTIDAGEGDNVVFGDDGRIAYAADGRLDCITSTSTNANGGVDDITAGAGQDLVFGGRFGDTIDAGAGNNVVFGDSGRLIADAASTSEHWNGHPLPAGTIKSLEHADGGNDTITTLGGQDIVVGGNADDTIDAGDGDNVVFGDDGQIVYATDGRLASIVSMSTTTNGGIDDITTGANEDIVLGGRFGDVINAGSGDNVVFGDNGQLVANPLSTTLRLAGHPLPTGTIESIEHADGGDDTINTLGGNDMIVGGHAADTINAGDGDNLAFGDEGQIVYANDGRLSLITSTSTTAFGGADNITSGAGQDIVVGGRLGDTIHAGAGNNVVFGDSGQLVANPASFVYPWASHPLPIGMLETIEPGDGGIDTITTLGGEDLVLGGDASDVINTNAGDDVVIADHATVDYVNGIAVRITTTDTSIGGDDNIHAGADDDVVIGGTGSDAIDGGSGRDLLLGDSANLDRSATLGNFRNPRFRALTGTQIYSTVSETAGSLLIDTGTYYRDPRGPAEWADYQITQLHHETVVAANLYGDDYIAGGADDDMIFGQMGNDVVQGDGSIDFVSGGGRVGASRDAAGLLVLRASFEAATDGHDYIEGGGGADVLFGNNGQDDIIGGSSSLFSRITPNQRPDAADFIFGGAGTDAGRNDAGDTTAQGHANDADTIVGDNGNIFRIVTPGVDGASTLRTFNYDNYSASMRIVPRAVDLIDYTDGGPSYAGQAGPMVLGDIGGADEIHGESGDDTIYGGALSDVIYGDAQDDDLIGGYGHDWISGGTGDDGIIGDDGRIFTARNGTAEPLNGIAAVAQTTLVGNGSGTINATVNVLGTLQKNVDLTPFNLDPNHAAPNMLYDATFADDIIFGGLGRDFIHAGSGDDAVSGAEALNEAYFVSNGALVRSDFNRPNNPGDTLDYNETTTLLGQYDPNNPMRRIVLNANGTLSTNNVGKEFFLNFDPTEGPLVAGSTTARTDGDDLIFGDHGNDWLVGGTGRDHIFAGWGDDLINADDDHRTNGALNNQPDAELSYGDIALGGAGRDVLIANTAADILVDSTEFDTFMIPFAKYGPPTVNRSINPALEEFLYSLGQADGADQTRVSPGVTGTASGSAQRHGEPFGELALVTHSDGAAHDQHGGPRDPQSGNEGGTSADSGTTAGTSVKKSGTTAGTTTTGTTSALTSSTTPMTSTSSTEPVTATTTITSTSAESTPSIDWSGKTSDVTTLPWAQGTQPKPVGLAMPTFDLEDDDDDLIDWSATTTIAAPVTVVPSTTTTTLLSSPTKKN